jgi:SAM-dependent methyltransferase
MNLKALAKNIIPRQFHSAVQTAYFWLRSRFYWGGNVECPCCGGRFRRFVTVNDIPDVQCPRCGLLPRHRLLWLYLKNRTNFYKDNLRVLDVAPTRLFQQQCRKLANIEYISVDIDSPLAMMRVDITDMPFPDSSFDCIICYHVLEHIVDDRQAMRQLYRVLKPGGWAVIQSPVDMDRETTYEDHTIISPEARRQAFGQEDHVRIYGRDYVERLKEAGFRVSIDKYVSQLDEIAISLYGLDPDEVIYCCFKA